ncbi:hypothetical protein AK812_SmicGene48063, partial [Symbiodinium microadriaticum]
PQARGQVLTAIAILLLLPWGVPGRYRLERRVRAPLL